jgi:beta-glucanase (GH16 family)
MRIVSRVWLFAPAAILLLMAAPNPAPAATWHQDFNTCTGSSRPDPTWWNYDIGGGGWGNNELEYYRAENAWVSNCNLNIEARRESFGGMGYTSARLKTQGKRPFGPYGYMQARIKAPMGKGFWPAFWMLGSNITSVAWPGCGEIDIMEHINSDPNVLGTIHWNNTAGAYAYYTAMNTAASVGSYHTYAINWTSSDITWYVDGASKGAANIAGNINGTEEFHKPFFVILNLAVGGSWPGSPDGSTAFPSRMSVDWIYWN